MDPVPLTIACSAYDLAAPQEPKPTLSNPPVFAAHVPFAPAPARGGLRGQEGAVQVPRVRGASEYAPRDGNCARCPQCRGR
eukprot:CAMPEP_0174282610 /NCGR_PEP_ID=MMETSP0809-20121228/3152_1 /TAXON_ID=73025 ORGANISM="Eutreptiella gymnastica-like, Strain CCMP1594" /NCGR_SAMPLE_ID=MMETSP0809 /ASSEMBLY_ACC=CAM_ASM_000658 /LENGTH=80 /DNA_ID=CAMNT_0015376945 /DNA_START=295 /DNA_END=534 /DNA_ORIENTATION=-